MRFKEFLRLQMFAEEPAEETVEETSPEEETEKPKAEEKKYTDKELDAIIGKKFAKWQKQQEEAVKNAKTEAEKLAKMNADQKQQYEYEKLQEENRKLKEAQARIELGRTASTLLSEHDIEATQEMLDFVVGADAETTQANIDKFVKIIESQIKKAEVKRATGTTPKAIRNNQAQLSEIQQRIAKYKK